jgi:hypothetical protein
LSCIHHRQRGGFRKRELYLDPALLPAELTGAAVDHTAISDPPGWQGVIAVTQLGEKPGSSNRWRGLHAG